MPDFFNTIKQIAVAAVAAEKPVEICYGTVQSRSPFRVRLSQKLVLDANFFIVPARLSAQSFAVGDTLILLRVQGGQKYLIFDKTGVL